MRKQFHASQGINFTFTDLPWQADVVANWNSVFLFTVHWPNDFASLTYTAHAHMSLFIIIIEHSWDERHIESRRELIHPVSV